MHRNGPDFSRNSSIILDQKKKSPRRKYIDSSTEHKPIIERSVHYCNQYMEQKMMELKNSKTD